MAHQLCCCRTLARAAYRHRPQPSCGRCIALQSTLSLAHSTGAHAPRSPEAEPTRDPVAPRRTWI
eukprot:2983356-Prymnesium_polylepis.2